MRIPLAQLQLTIAAPAPRSATIRRCNPHRSLFCGCTLSAPPIFIPSIGDRGWIESDIASQSSPHPRKSSEARRFHSWTLIQPKYTPSRFSSSCSFHTALHSKKKKGSRNPDAKDCGDFDEFEGNDASSSDSDAPLKPPSQSLGSSESTDVPQTSTSLDFSDFPDLSDRPPSLKNIESFEDDFIRRMIWSKDLNKQSDSGKASSSGKEAQMATEGEAEAKPIEEDLSPLVPPSHASQKSRRSKRRKKEPVLKWPPQLSTRPLLLTFDAFDTLFTPNPSVFEQYVQVAAEFGVTVTNEAVQKGFKESFKALLSEYPNYGRDAGMTPREWWRKLIHRTFAVALGTDSIPHGNKINANLWRRFSSSEGYRLFDDVQPFLKLLGNAVSAHDWAPSRTMIGVVSNSDSRTLSILRSFGIPTTTSMFPTRMLSAQLFDPFIRSHAHPSFIISANDPGVHAKPDPRAWDGALAIAQRCLDHLHPVARTTRTGTRLLNDIAHDFHHLHIGDELEKDVLPALRAGWDAILIDRSAEERVSERPVPETFLQDFTTDDNTPIPSTYTVINSLAALPEIITAARLEGTHDQRETWSERPKPPSTFKYHKKKGVANYKGRKAVRVRGLPKRSRVRIVI